jgi:DNA repair photolyase
MSYQEIQAKSVLRKQKKVDSWFLSSYGMNLYRGCTHNCAYCDGRSEGYYVEGEFGRDVQIKVNAIEVLRRELDPSRKRTPFKAGFIVVGGGVCDSYQPAEQKYRLTRRTLELLAEREWPVHMLTKSCLIEQDIDLLCAINDSRRAIVSMSFSSVDDDVSRRFEPGVSLPSRRLHTLRLCKQAGLATGMFLMPVIPFITDKPDLLKGTFAAAHDIGVDFIIFSGMTLKEGRQKDHFLSVLNDYDPALPLNYEVIYRGEAYGNAIPDYYRTLHQTLFAMAREFQIPVRMPMRLWQDILPENDRVIVILEHIDYFLKSSGQRSPYGYAAWSLANIKEPLSRVRAHLEQVNGVGSAVAMVVREILDTGTSRFYQRLMRGEPFPAL